MTIQHLLMRLCAVLEDSIERGEQHVSWLSVRESDDRDRQLHDSRQMIEMDKKILGFVSSLCVLES